MIRFDFGRRVSARLETVCIAVHARAQIAAIEAVIAAKIPHRGTWPRPSANGHVRRGGSDPVVARPLAGELVITYVFDDVRGRELLHASDLSQLGVDRETLHRAALINTWKRLESVVCNATDTPGLFHIRAGGDYDAALLAIEEVWHTVDARIDGQRVVSAPNRDLLLVTGSNNSAGLSRMQAIARHLAERSHPISHTRLVWRDEGWGVFDPAIKAPVLARLYS